MKILLAASTITPRAGISAFNRELCKALSCNNLVHLMCYENISEYPDCEKVISLPTISLKNTKDYLKLMNIIKAENYDIIINSNSKIMALFAPYLNDTTKLVTVSHSLRYTESDIAAFNSEYVDGIIALSYYNKDYLKKKFRIHNNRKIEVIYNFVSPLENANEIREKKKKSKEISIVYAGGTSSSKSPELVIKVLNKLLNTNIKFKFYFLGVKTPPLKKIQPFKNVESIIKHDDRVLLPGKVPSEEARNIIANCNVFLAPSRREGCPIALLEALRVGCIPIVADYKIANRELINDGENGFVINHRHPDEFVNRIVDIISNHQAYSQIYDKTYELFISSLTYEVWNKKMTSIITSDDGQLLHKTRKPKFSAICFKFDKICFFFMDLFNNIHLFFHESLPAALPIMKMYLFDK